MKFPKHVFTLALWPFLLVQTCVKDSEETNDADNNALEIRYDENETVTKAMAIEDWEMFLKQSQESIDRIEASIGKLEIKIDEATDYQKNQWLATCDMANRSLIKLKAARVKRNKEFEKELEAYDRSTYEKNEAFEIKFNTEMANIDAKLGSLLEKIFSGYYK